MLHGVASLRRLREMPYATVQQIGREANQLNMECPLFLPEYAGKAQFLVPSYSPEKLSGAQVLAVMVFSLWVMCGESEDNAAPLVRAWPIREAVMLAGKKEVA